MNSNKEMEQQEIFKLLGVPVSVASTNFTNKETSSIDIVNIREVFQQIKIKCFDELTQINKKYNVACKMLSVLDELNSIETKAYNSSSPSEPLLTHRAKPKRHSSRAKEESLAALAKRLVSVFDDENEKLSGKQLQERLGFNTVSSVHTLGYRLRKNGIHALELSPTGGYMYQLTNLGKEIFNSKS